jgi:hypothetical protein
MNLQKHLISINTSKAIGAMSLVVATALFSSGCSSEEPAQAQTQEPQKKLLTINEVEEGKYVIVDEVPYSENKAIVKDLNGTETVYNEAELKKFAEAEMAKVENNTSNLTNPNPQVSQDSGLSFGEVLLAGAAGAILGSVIGNMLSNNSNYQANQQRYNQSPAAQQRFSSMGSSTPKTAPTKESFFNKNSAGSTTTNSGSSSNTGSSSSSKSSFFGGSKSGGSSSFGG